MSKKILIILLLFSTFSLTACSKATDTDTHYDPASLRFSGEQALTTLTDFVEKFPYRSSGQPNSYRATIWLKNEFKSYGLNCRIDEWEVVNYSKPVRLRNVIAKLPGESSKEIVLVAHHDQSPDTIQGADNDGSGIAVLLQLAQIFAPESTPKYTLVFLATDAEEYGMVGARRYVKTHSNISNIVASISLDNIGKEFYNGVIMSPTGQFRGYGPLWLLLTFREAARTAGNLWIPQFSALTMQIIDQAVPVSTTDQGPFVAQGIPALGFAGAFDKEFKELDWETYHTPKDTVEYQSAKTLHQFGRITEALVRELQTINTFPKEAEPYLYFDRTHQVLRGIPLWTIFFIFISLFFIGSHIVGPKTLTEKLQGWRLAFFHFFSLWLPLIFSIILLYAFVFIGLMDKYHIYPATAKDEPIFQPRWPAVILFLAGLALFILVGRIIARKYYERLKIRPTQSQTNGLALLIVGLAGVYILAINPFSLLFLAPVLFWLLIKGRKGAGKVLDIVLFVLGGLTVYLLLYFFGFVYLHNNFVMLWYLMMMFSIQMISFPTAAVIMAILAAGLSMIINPPRLEST